MKKSLIAVVFVMMAGGAYAADFPLTALRVSDIKMAPAQTRSVKKPQLAIPDSVESVGITEVKNKSGDYFTLRYVLEKHDIYPQLKIEIFQRGYEGENTVINATIEVYGNDPVSDSQIENVKWASSGYTLMFKLNGKDCVLDLGENFSKVGKNFENAASLKYACAK